MNRLQRLLTIALLCASAGASAVDQPPPTGPTFRIVGPDGKVTYSDRKPTDEKLQARQLSTVAPTAPLFTPGTSLFEPPRPGTPATSARDLAPPLTTAGKPFPPGLPDAVLSVLGHQFYVQTLVETCGRSAPGAAERFQIVVRNWRDRNADMLGRSNRITFTLFSSEQRELLRATARSRLQRLLAPPDATESERAGWCDHAADDVVRRRLELTGDPHLAPIANFEMN
ncbi:MAG: hypothetical protein ABJD97_09570 [Betaproteobacteria bacterium]